MCFGEHIDKDVDLVILEIAINDQRYVVRLRTVRTPNHPPRTDPLGLL